MIFIMQDELHIDPEHSVCVVAGVVASDYVTVDSVVRGHHVYKEIWTPEIGELQLEQEVEMLMTSMLLQS